MKNLKGKSICIFSSKGGCGKSTTAINLAGIFSSLEKNVLIIDFDLFSGVISTYLNLPCDKTIFTLIDDYANNRFTTFSDYVKKYNDYISILPVCTDPRESAKISPNYIDIILSKAIYEYDYVIVDMSHSLDEFNITLLDKVDKILMLITNDLLALKNTRNVISIFKDAEKNNYKILLNECTTPNQDYYSLYDIKNIIKANIDYNIKSNFYLKSIQNYISDGKILTLENKMPKVYPKVYKTYMQIVKDMMEDKNE